MMKDVLNDISMQTSLQNRERSIRSVLQIFFDTVILDLIGNEVPWKTAGQPYSGLF